MFLIYQDRNSGHKSQKYNISHKTFSIIPWSNIDATHSMQVYSHSQNISNHKNIIKFLIKINNSLVYSLKSQIYKLSEQSTLGKTRTKISRYWSIDHFLPLAASDPEYFKKRSPKINFLLICRKILMRFGKLNITKPF